MKALVTSLLFFSVLALLILENSSLFAEENSITEDEVETIDKIASLEDVEVATFTMEITDKKKGKPSKNSPMRMTYYLNHGQIAIKPEMEDEQNTVMIYDIEDKTMTTLIDQNGERTGMKMKMPSFKLDSKELDGFDATIEATNETRTIDGYDCKKYLIESSDYKGHAWITEEVDLDFEKIFSFLNIKKDSKSKMPKFGDIDGFAMETYSKHKSKDEEYEMKVIDLKVGEVDEAIFDTSEYTITDMSSLLNLGGER